MGRPRPSGSGTFWSTEKNGHLLVALVALAEYREDVVEPAAECAPRFGTGLPDDRQGLPQITEVIVKCVQIPAA